MNGNNNGYQGAQKKSVSLAGAKKRRVAQKRQNYFFAVCILIILMLLSGWLIFDKLFIINSFSVKGLQEYSEEEATEIASRIGLEKGMHMFGFNKDELQKEAKYYLSEFDSVKIKWSLPDKLVFDVKEAVPAMYITENGKNYILSQGLRVISVTDDAAVPEGLALKRVYVGDIVKCQTGEFLETSSGSDEVLTELYAVLVEEGIAAEVTEINVENKFAITFLYKQRFTVELGSADNFTVKIRFLNSIVNKLRDTDSGYIDVSDEDLREGIFKAYE